MNTLIVDILTLQVDQGLYRRIFSTDNIWYTTIYHYLYLLHKKKCNIIEKHGIQNAFGYKVNFKLDVGLLNDLKHLLDNNISNSLPIWCKPFSLLNFPEKQMKINTLKAELDSYINMITMQETTILVTIKKLS